MTLENFTDFAQTATIVWLWAYVLRERKHWRELERERLELERSWPEISRQLRERRDG